MHSKQSDAKKKKHEWCAAPNKAGVTSTVRISRGNNRHGTPDVLDVLDAGRYDRKNDSM